MSWPPCKPGRTSHEGEEREGRVLWTDSERGCDAQQVTFGRKLRASRFFWPRYMPNIECADKCDTALWATLSGVGTLFSALMSVAATNHSVVDWLQSGGSSAALGSSVVVNVSAHFLEYSRAHYNRRSPRPLLDHTRSCFLLPRYGGVAERTVLHTDCAQ